VKNIPPSISIKRSISVATESPKDRPHHLTHPPDPFARCFERRHRRFGLLFILFHPYFRPPPWFEPQDDFVSSTLLFSNSNGLESFHHTAQRLRSPDLFFKINKWLGVRAYTNGCTSRMGEKQLNRWGFNKWGMDECFGGGSTAASQLRNRRSTSWGHIRDVYSPALALRRTPVLCKRWIESPKQKNSSQNKRSIARSNSSI